MKFLAIALGLSTLGAYAQEKVILKIGDRVKKVEGVKVMCVDDIHAPRRKTVYLKRGQTINIAGTEVQCVFRRRPRQRLAAGGHWTMGHRFSARYLGENLGEKITKTCMGRSSCTFTPTELVPYQGRDLFETIVIRYTCHDRRASAVGPGSDVEMMKTVDIDTGLEQKVTLTCPNL